jgi:hypothetical protein
MEQAVREAGHSLHLVPRALSLISLILLAGPRLHVETTFVWYEGLNTCTYYPLSGISNSGLNCAVWCISCALLGGHNYPVDWLRHVGGGESKENNKVFRVRCETEQVTFWRLLLQLTRSNCFSNPATLIQQATYRLCKRNLNIRRPEVTEFNTVIDKQAHSNIVIVILTLSMCTGFGNRSNLCIW